MIAEKRKLDEFCREVKKLSTIFLMKFAQEMERVSLAKENIRLWCYT